MGIGYTANRSVHRNCPTNSKFFELFHWHLQVLFIQLRIGSNTGLMVLQPYMVQRECNRLQRFFPLRRLQFTLPYCDAVPAHFSQFTLFLLVTLLVSSNLSYPELTIRLRNLAALRTLDVIFRLTSDITLCPCQKHPFTKMHVLYFLSTKSGCPGNRLWFSLYLNPRFHSPRRTIISGFVSFDLTAAMLSCRCCTVSLSMLAKKIFIPNPHHHSFPCNVSCHCHPYRLPMQDQIHACCRNFLIRCGDTKTRIV